MDNNNFEEAKTATEDMFTEGEQPNTEEEQVENVETPIDAETPETEQPEPAAENQEKDISDDNQVLSDAAQTAETAAQVARQKDAELQRVLQENEALKNQNSDLQNTITQMSQQQQEEVIEDALEPPVLDVSALAFADEETVRAAQANYAKEMAEYNRKQIMEELSPFVKQAKEGMYEKEKRDVVSALSQVPELDGIEQMMPQIEKIIKNNSALSADNIPLDEKLITAYAIARGVNSMNTPPPKEKELTNDELMEIYNNNQGFQEMIEKQRLEAIKGSQQVPPFSASSGAVNAALNIKDKPKTFEEASQRTRHMFGLD